jgi:hypothetical protein
MLEPVTTGQIYWGAIPFVVIQIIMVALIIAFPGMVAYDKPQAAGTGPQIDIQQMIQQDQAGAPGGATPEGSGEQQSDDDLTRSLGGAGAAPACGGRCGSGSAGAASVQPAAARRQATPTS